MEKKYFIETFGCQMNIHDSEKIAGVLRDLGYEETKAIETSDIIVFNTCCIRETAELKIMAKIGETKRLKKQNPDLIIVVCGCMTQQKGVADLIKKRFPFVSVILGTHNLDELKDYILDYSYSKKFQKNIWEKEKEIVEGGSFYRTSGYNAWVNIMYGCNNFCTYCIVPYVRGRERSRKIEDIVKEVKNLVNENYKTITLLGQNVNSYGKDLGKDINFVTLLKELVKIEGDFKIKFLTSHPKDFSLELIDFISQNEKMSKTIHLPVQSGSDKILQKMNRHYDIKRYKFLVDNIYKKIPSATLTTDIIVGFPGENEEDFNSTIDLLKYCNFSRIFGFVYSKRNGTPAATFKDQVDKKTKQRRIVQLFSTQSKITKRLTQEMVGKTFKCIVEDFKDGFYLVKTYGDKTIKVENDNLKIGKDVDVVVKDYKDGELLGEII